VQKKVERSSKRSDFADRLEAAARLGVSLYEDLLHRYYLETENV